MNSHRLMELLGPIVFAAALFLTAGALAAETGVDRPGPPQHEAPTGLKAGTEARQGQPMESMDQGEMAGGRGGGGMTCTCPKGVMHGGGIVLAILAGLALLSATAALAALAVFLVRRSRQAQAV